MQSLRAIFFFIIGSVLLRAGYSSHKKMNVRYWESYSRLQKPPDLKKACFTFGTASAEFPLRMIVNYRQARNYF
jgi:hypothetical protein